jgi:hypothetical protein
MSEQEFIRRTLPVLKEMDSDLTLEQRKAISNEILKWYKKNRQKITMTVFKRILKKHRGY